GRRPGGPARRADRGLQRPIRKPLYRRRAWLRGRRDRAAPHTARADQRAGAFTDEERAPAAKEAWEHSAVATTEGGSNGIPTRTFQARRLRRLEAGHVRP